MIARIERTFARAGAQGALHVVDLEDGRDVAVDADEPVVMASVFKLAVLAELFRGADAGEVDVRARVTLTGDGLGLTGIAQLRDPVEMSLRDLAQSMITISDCTAADAVFDRLGEAAINANLARLGLRATTVRGCCRDMLAAAAAGSLPCTTARDMTTLLAAIWRDGAASPGACAEMRRMLGLQVWPHRLASGFPSDTIHVAGKTGTWPGIRNEVGVVSYPDDRHYAVAVFTITERPGSTIPEIDHAIGTAARIAVDALRRDGGEGDRTPTSAVQRPRAPIITTPPGRNPA